MLMDVLDEAGVEHIVPEGAFYMWCRAPESFGADDMAFCDYLKNTIFFLLREAALAERGGFGLRTV